MSDYQDGKNVLRSRPEPGRGTSQSVEKVIEKQASPLDVDAIAAAVVKAMGNKMPVVMHGGGVGVKIEDNFDNSKTLERLADSMVTQGGNNESNFGDLGKIQTTKKDVQSTIDLLTDIDEGE